MIVNFEKYNKPPLSAVSSAHRRDFESEPLKWVRLECDWYRDVDILDLPRQVRSLWPQLIAMAGSSIPHGTVFTSVQNLAKAGNLGESEVAEALTFLWKRHKIRYSVGGKRHPAATQPPPYVRTYVRTNERTAIFEKNDDEVTRLRRLLADVSDPGMRATLERKLARLTA